MRSGGDRNSGFTMELDDQAFLDQIEQNIREKDDEQDSARREAEQRAREMERIRKAVGAAPTPKPGGKKAGSTEPAKKNPLEDDPRYREYFERLKRQKGEATSPETMPATSSAGSPLKSVQAKAAEGQTVGPGAIVRFDDGSIGIYKDAVSGRDYALFYFLQPDGQFAPEGVFLQAYQAKVIGNLPENYFAELRDDGTWNRDLILFHLSKFEHVQFLNNVAEHEDRKPPKNATPARNQVMSQPQQPAQASQQKQPVQPATSAPAQDDMQPEPQKSAASAPPASAQTGATPTPASNHSLVKGRKFQIVFGGKKWEAVYWTSDENGAIVAHSTHGDWSLMRLDLERFKDSLELGDVVDSDTLNTIAESAAKAK